MHITRILHKLKLQLLEKKIILRLQNKKVLSRLQKNSVFAHSELTQQQIHSEPHHRMSQHSKGFKHLFILQTPTETVG